MAGKSQEADPSSPPSLVEALKGVVTNLESFRKDQARITTSGTSTVFFEIPGLPGAYSFIDSELPMPKPPAVLSYSPTFQEDLVRKELGLPPQSIRTRINTPSGWSQEMFKGATQQIVEFRHGSRLTRVRTNGIVLDLPDEIFRINNFRNFNNTDWLAGQYRLGYVLHATGDKVATPPQAASNLLSKIQLLRDLNKSIVEVRPG